ncbi:DUF645 family protein, partial [Vibrio cholerae]
QPTSQLLVLDVRLLDAFA